MQGGSLQLPRKDAPAAGTPDASCPGGGIAMSDVLLVLATAAFFGLSWGYARLCERL